MAGRFEGVSDLEWCVFEDVFPPPPAKCGRGMPYAPFRKILPALLYVLITGCRWGDVPRGHNGRRRAPRIAGCNAGRPMAR
jgi:transposase